MRRSIIILVLLMAFPLAALAAEPEQKEPRWSLELKGGVMFPETARWNDFYSQSYLGAYGGTLAYKVIRQVEVGVGASYLRATGFGALPQHGNAVSTTQVTYELVPLDVFVLARGTFRKRQPVVPYLGGGWTRLFYRERVDGGSETRGSVNGFHARAGIQLLLDPLDPDAAKSLLGEYGVSNTYFFVEGRYLRATADTIPSGSAKLGGGGVLSGILFEF